MRVAAETGTHVRWVAELVRGLGHEMLVANARQVRLVFAGHRKNDQLDAEKLARLARVDPQLLNPVSLRSRQAHADRALVMARDNLIAVRTKLINSVKGTLKSFGKRVRSGDANAFHRRATEVVPEELVPAIDPVLETIEHLTLQIRRYDKLIDAKCKQYPVTTKLMQINGVGPITSLTFALTLGDPNRFARSRDVGAYLGLVPKERQTGGNDPELGISKAGDANMRRLLVQCAHYMLGPFGKDSDLRRFGERIMARGGKTQPRGKKRTSPKKRAAVAVARKLAVVMHRLWTTDADYEPLHASETAKAA